MSQPVIITGMHRSGTSFVAELFRAAGVHIGERLFPGDVGNPRGYFEDEDFLALQRTMLAEACGPGAIGWPDWGWMETGTLNEAIWAQHEPAMRALAETRQQFTLWGWKDPRTTLLLERWLDILPEASFVLVVREPWKVAASVRRLPAEIFMSRPEVGVKVWMFYNQRVLDFARAHSDRTVVLPLSWLSNSPHAVLGHGVERLGLNGLRFDANECAAIVQGRQRDAHAEDPGNEREIRLQHPEAIRLWQDLLKVASGV